MASGASGIRRDDQSSANAPRRIKCTYTDCYRYFSSEKEMKVHKTKEPSHEYCHKCDVDCKDDSDLLIHMIESGRHIVCPMCGFEFKSNAGLESHIPQASYRLSIQDRETDLTNSSLQTHQHSQDLKCIGCGDKFTRAAALMQHIESDECKVITQEVFERRRAEKAVAKDAWAAQLIPQAEHNVPRGNVSMFSDVDPSEHGGVSLLDTDNVLESEAHSSVLRDYLTPSLNMLSLRDQYPTLPHLNSTKHTKAADQNTEGDLMSFDGDDAPDEEHRSQSAWNTKTPAASNLFENSKWPPKSAIETTRAADRSSVSKMSLSTDPNAHLSIQPAPLTPFSILEPMNHFNDLTSKFECPGKKCGGVFATIEAFNAHLTSKAHVGGRTICPSCLAKFPSTMALVAHCESPSKRCNIRNTANYNQILREITGGLIGAEGHHIDGSVKYVANDISKPGYW